MKNSEQSIASTTHKNYVLGPRDWKPSAPKDWGEKTWCCLWTDLKERAKHLVSSNSSPGGYEPDEFATDTILRLKNYSGSIGMFKTWGDVRAYSYKTMQNLLIDHRRKAKKQQADNPEHLDHLADHTLSEPDKKLDITRALQQLSKDDRELIYLRFVEGMKQKEISRRLDVSEARISQRLKVLRLRLSEILELPASRLV